METANMKCRIWLPYGKKAKLASYFGVSSETVRKALAFECGDNDFHEMIRKEAIKNYGGEKKFISCKYAG